MTEFSAADALTFVHTYVNESPVENPAAESAQPYPGESTGQQGSTSRAIFLAPKILGGSLRGVRIVYASPQVGTGQGTLTHAGPTGLVFTAPNGAPGVQTGVAVGAGVRLVPSADPSRYILVERYESGAQAGDNLDIAFLEAMNAVPAGSNLTDEETTDSAATGAAAHFSDALLVLASGATLPTAVENNWYGWQLEFTEGDASGQARTIMRFSSKT